MLPEVMLAMSTWYVTLTLSLSLLEETEHLHKEEQRSFVRSRVSIPIVQLSIEWNTKYFNKTNVYRSQLECGKCGAHIIIILVVIQ